MNYKMTCIYDDKKVVIENDEVVSVEFCDNRLEYKHEIFGVVVTRSRGEE